jgi:hypothetical protein
MRAFPLVLVALVVPAAAGARITPAGGLHGVVTRGPTAPMCVAEAPCSEPAKNVTLVFSRSDHVAGRVVTDGQGRYQLRLPPGLYSVRRAASAGLDNRLDPNRVRVSARRFVHVDFSIDTGIR